MIPWTVPDWPAPPGVRALTTHRHGVGYSQPPFDDFNLGNARSADGDDAATVERNRALLAEIARLPGRPRWLRQVHGTGVLRFERDGSVPPGVATEPEADAAVTATPGEVLAILTADCLPVLFCALDGTEIGAAHAGWRGLAGGVLEATLAALRTAPDAMLVWLGPAAGPQHYEIGGEVREAFLAADAGAASAFVASRPGHWHVDLYALARRRLTAAGVPEARIHGGDLCTIADPGRFYSHRRDGRTGRMATLIWWSAV